MTLSDDNPRDLPLEEAYSLIRHYAREIRASCDKAYERQVWLASFLSVHAVAAVILAASSLGNPLLILPALVAAIFCALFVVELRRLRTQVGSVEIVLDRVIRLHQRTKQSHQFASAKPEAVHLISVDVEMAIRSYTAINPQFEGGRSPFDLLPGRD